MKDDNEQILNNGDERQHEAGVILFHGLTGMPSELRPVARHLTKMGYLVECPMLPGHGAGHPELLAAGWKDWMRCAREAIDEMAKRVPKIFIGGLSMGSIIATIAAAEDKRVDGIIALSPTLQYDGINTTPYGFFLFIIDVIPWLGHKFYWTEQPPYGLRDERLQRQIKKSIEAAERGESDQFGLFRTYAGSLRQLEHLVFEFRRKAPRAKCPVIVIHSLEDTLTTVQNPMDFCKLIGSRDRELILLSGCDHVLTLDLRKHDVCDRVGKFVAKIAPVKSPTGSLQTV
ncbi:MAG TPA: alpha/beta fold hydrolase [Drouetiella sp.]